LPLEPVEAGDLNGDELVHALPDGHEGGNCSAVSFQVVRRWLAAVSKARASLKRRRIVVNNANGQFLTLGSSDGATPSTDFAKLNARITDVGTSSNSSPTGGGHRQ
jgi:hypothetical protein